MFLTGNNCSISGIGKVTAYNIAYLIKDAAQINLQLHSLVFDNLTVQLLSESSITPSITSKGTSCRSISITLSHECKKYYQAE